MEDEYAVELHIPTLLLALARNYKYDKTTESSPISTLDVEDYLETMWVSLTEDKVFTDQTTFIEDTTVDEVGPGGMRMVGGMFEMKHIASIKEWAVLFRSWLEQVISNGESLQLLRRTLGQDWYDSSILGAPVTVVKLGESTAAEMVLLKVSDGLEDFENTLATLL